jgi:hypothetical protein
VTPDGRFLLVGTLGAGPTPRHEIYVYRILRDGALARLDDATFAGEDALTSLELSPDGTSRRRRTSPSTRTPFATAGPAQASRSMSPTSRATAVR